MDHEAILQTLIAYHEAFAERDVPRRLELLARSMTADAEIWGPKRVFAGYEEISEKITGFHRNWPECRLALTTGFNTFLNTAHLGAAIIGPDGSVRATGRSVIEFADDGRIQRVLPLWEALPPLPEGWPGQFAPGSGRVSVNADYFRELERERTQALVTQNMEAAERLHSPEYHLITPGGKSFNRETYFSAIASGALRYLRWESDEIEVRLSSSMAIVRYRASLQFPSGSVVECWHTDSYEPHDGRWQAVWSQATAISPSATPEPRRGELKN